MKDKANINYNIHQGLPTPLGISKNGNSINVAAAVSDNKNCVLLLYRKGEKSPSYEIPFIEQYRYGDIYTMCIEEFPIEEYDYMFRINGEILPDTYAKRIVGREKWGTKRNQDEIRCRTSYEEYDWEDDSFLMLPYSEVIIYSLHVRGFTKHVTSKVSEKGTFRGIIEKIPYLLELGINAVELMPVYEFDEVFDDNEMAYRMTNESSVFMGTQLKGEKKINYWGYGDGNYFAPKASYAAENPVTEFKDMVKALHKAGIEVILEFFFSKQVNQNQIIDCIKFWVMEYHIDGAHINGESLPITALAMEPLLSRTKLLHWGFPLDEIYKQGYIPYYKNLADYNEEFLFNVRKFLKGDEDQVNGIAYHMRKNPARQGVINYISNHNGFTLMDAVSYDVKHNEANGENNRDGNNYNYTWNCGVEGPSRKKKILELRKKQIKNAFAMLLLSQGTPLILSGDEVCHSQKGNNNAYCQDNEISWLHWNRNIMSEEIFGFVKQLIALRKKHPILHKPDELKIMDYISCGYPDLSYHGENAWRPEFQNYSRILGIMLCGKYAKVSRNKEDAFFYFAYNMHWEKHEFALPSLPKDKKWHLVTDTNENKFYAEELLLKDQRSYLAQARTVVILIGM